MTISQRVVWTLLPNGSSSPTKLKATVLVSPRLTLGPGDTPANLSKFPNWLDWPAVVASSKFTVFCNGLAVSAKAVQVVSKPDSGTWASLFAATTFVKPYEFTDLSGKVILSYPVAQIAKSIEKLYGQLGVAANGDLPSVRELRQAIGDRKKRKGQDVLAALRTEAQNPSNTSLRQPEAALDLLAAYHRPLQTEQTFKHTKKNKDDPQEDATWPGFKRADLPSPDFKNRIDFHQIVSSLAQYSELSRLCGLVIDLEIAADAIPQGDSVLQLGSVLGQATDVLPQINVRRQGQKFEAAPQVATSPLSGRFLKLQGGGFDLVEMDVDGAGMKLKNLETNLVRPQPVTYDDETFEPAPLGSDKAGAPSLRSAGLMLAQERRDLAVKALFTRSADHQKAFTDGKPPPLFAEDIIRGYRVDIRDETTHAWQSLNRRTIEFGFVNTGGKHTTKEEEGMARLAAGSSADGSNADIIKLHEGLFAWRGWSLAAPEPGRVVGKDDKVTSGDDTTPAGLPLKTRFGVVPGSLPMLRFGRKYTVRVRLVDLAGESVPYSKTDIQAADALSNTVAYRRFEPVEAPGLALFGIGPSLEAPQDGESMERIAIRTFNADSPDPPPPAAGKARRHLLPPRSTHKFAEQHGVMDTPAGKLDPEKFAMLAKLDEPLAQVEIKPAAPSGARPTVYAAAPGTFTLPYLPDPLAVGVAIRVEGAAGVTSQIHKIPLYKAGLGPNVEPDWPNALPFTIVVSEGGVPDAQFLPDSREFIVPLRKAERARVRVSSLIPLKSLTKMAISQMIAEQNPTPAQASQLAVLIMDGQHWMYTPWRTLELVHAVQKPLIQPSLANLGHGRKPNAISAPLSFSTPLHAKSSVRLDLEGRWNEPKDDPSKAGPVSKGVRGHAFDIPISRSDAPKDLYDVRAKDHVFGDTRYRRVTYRLDATTRYREFMPAAIREKDTLLKVSSKEQRIWIPNSAPPPPPEVVYVVPTFGWSRQTGSATSTSMRSGGGLRVYLDRPWFVSGFGEMLGVVLPPTQGQNTQGGPVFNDLFGPHVTQWGVDPIWNAGRIKTVAPSKSAFPLARWKGPITMDGTGMPAEEGTDLPPGDFPVDGLIHPELGTGSPVRLNVAPHAVGYDAERGLWYADIVIRPPGSAYYPFVRLALARYHPVSVQGAHLSSIVMAEFMQLTPDRMAIVTHAANALSAHVAVYGSSPKQSLQVFPLPGMFELEAQVLDAGADPDLGWRTAKPQTSAQATITFTPSFASAALQDEPPAANSPLQAEARKLAAEDNFRALVARPDLMLALQPPLLWQGDVALPAKPPGGRRRILITEQEQYRANEISLQSGERTLGTRIVYLEALDV